MFDYSLEKLATGLPVLLIPMPGVSSLTVLCLANTGSRYETPEQEGIAHFFEHMVFKGTKNYPTAQILASTIDGIGADFNAFTSKEYTGYYVKAASRHFDLALDVVSDMMLVPNLNQDDIDREKGVIVEEIHMYQDLPQRYVGQLFEQLMFTGTSLGHDIIGSEKTVNQFVSQDFKQFLKKWYGLENLVLVVAGDEAVINAPGTLTKINALMGKLGESRRTGKQKLTKKFQSSYSKNKLHFLKRNSEQTHLILGWPGMKRTDKRRYALALQNIALGANMSSRLFSEVREKRGLAYYVASETELYQDVGMVGARAGVDPKRADLALEVMVNEFIKLATLKKPITAGELSRAKEFLAGKMALDYEDSQAVAQYYGLKLLLNDEVETSMSVLEKISQVELDEVNQLAPALFKPGQMRLALIGPHEDQAHFEKYLV